MPDLEKTSVYIVDDSEVTRSVIREMLISYADVSLAGEAADGEQAVREVLAKKPAVVIIDIGLPGLDGIQAMIQIKAQLPDTKVIILTSHDNDNAMFSAFTAGAAAYLVKSDFSQEKLIKAIYDVQSGRAWLDPGIARPFLKSAAAQGTDKLSSLSTEEKRVLQLVAEQSMPYSRPAQAAEVVAAGLLKEIDSAGPKEDWNSFLKRLEKFKE